MRSRRDPPTPHEADAIVRDMLPEVARTADRVFLTTYPTDAARAADRIFLATYPMDATARPRAESSFVQEVAVLADVLLYSNRPDLGEALASMLQNVARGESTVDRDLFNAFFAVWRSVLENVPLNAWVFRGTSISPPKRVRILDAGSDRDPFIKVGGYGYAEAWNTRGGFRVQDDRDDRGGISEPGERVYAVSKRPRGGALWYRASALHFVTPRKRTTS